MCIVNHCSIEVTAFYDCNFFRKRACRHDISISRKPVARCINCIFRVICREYPKTWAPGDEPYYPVNNEANNALYGRYAELGRAERDVVFAGRLGAYRYYDMAPCIAAALELAERELA